MAWLRSPTIFIGMALTLFLALAACGKSEPAQEAIVPKSGRQVATAELKKPSPSVPVITQAWRAHLPTIAAEQVPATLEQADAALTRGQLERGGSPGPGALELYLAVLVVEPANEAARRGVQSTLAALFEQGRLAMTQGRLPEAERIESMARAVQPEHTQLAAYRNDLGQAHAAQRLVLKAHAQAKAGKFNRPEGDNAMASFQSALAKVPEYLPAIEGLFHWHTMLLQNAWKAASVDDFQSADAYLLEAQRLKIDLDRQAVMELRIVELRQARTDALLSQGHARVDALQLPSADKLLNQVNKIAAQRQGVNSLRQRIHLARHYGPFKPGQVFSESLATGDRGPQMVVIPYGSFFMGSPDKEPDRVPNEDPRHEVVFARGFAIGRAEVTVADFARFVAATGYKTVATRRGRSTVYDEKGGVMSEHKGVDWQRDYVGRPAALGMPVVHIAFHDAQAYARWLSEQTGRKYRLPSEAEFEYALRAGSTTAYPWGAQSPRKLVGNLSGDGDASSTERTWGQEQAIASYSDGFWGPAPSGSFPQEAFGTVDMIGNVSEWTQDCWHDSYRRAPQDGSAWVNPGCGQRVARGASWAGSLPQARSAYRMPMAADATTARLGFRVAREL